MLLSIAKKGQSMFLLSFVFFIFIGTVLLKTSGTRIAGELSWVDAVFMATSAVCVTGLATVPATEFNIFGQLILVTLIQIGAIGVMTLGNSLGGMLLPFAGHVRKA